MKWQLNEWESDFFKRPIYQLNSQSGCALNSAMDNALLQAKVATTDFEHILYLQQQNFHLVETELQFAYDFSLFNRQLTACDCRLAEKSDLPVLKGWGGKAFLHTRFRPPYFTQEENQRFYQRWIENAVLGIFDDFCLIIEQNGKQLGIASLRFEPQQVRLGLLVVMPEYQEQGLGKNILNTAINFILHSQSDLSHKAEQLLITTQLSNIRAVKLYQSFGAKLSQSYYWFYRLHH